MAHLCIPIGPSSVPKSILPVPTRYRRILDSCAPYVVTSIHQSALAVAHLPAGIDMPPALHINPLTVGSQPFLDILQRLDELSFGPHDLRMPRWAFYDCAEMPGGIFGFARRAADVPDWARRTLGVDENYSGAVPLSMYMAIPMLEPGAWLGHSLCSLDEVVHGAAPANLALLTQAMGLQLFGVHTAYGATQWRSWQLAVSARFAPLELVTAWTPAHSDPRTVTFRFPVSTALIEQALASESPESGQPADTPAHRPALPAHSSIRWVDCDEDDDLRRLQADIENGRRFYIVGAPAVDGSYTRVPVCEGAPHEEAA